MSIAIEDFEGLFVGNHPAFLSTKVMDVYGIDRLVIQPAPMDAGPGVEGMCLYVGEEGLGQQVLSITFSLGDASDVEFYVGSSLDPADTPGLARFMNSSGQEIGSIDLGTSLSSPVKFSHEDGVHWIEIVVNNRLRLDYFKFITKPLTDRMR
jgi:hypothetical protein